VWTISIVRLTFELALVGAWCGIDLDLNGFLYQHSGNAGFMVLMLRRFWDWAWIKLFRDSEEAFSGVFAGWR